MGQNAVGFLRLLSVVWYCGGNSQTIRLPLSSGEQGQPDGGVGFLCKVMGGAKRYR